MSKWTVERKDWSGARSEKQEEARAAHRELWLQRQANKATKAAKTEERVDTPPPPAPVPPAPRTPWSGLKAGTADLRYFSRTDPTQTLFPQPWAKEITNLVLDLAESKKTCLCLLWPVRPQSIVALHAFADLERNFAKDLKGLRSVLYPGTSVSRAALQTTLLDRTKICALNASLWSIGPQGTSFHSHTRSVAFEALVSTLNNLERHNSALPDPSLGELIPTFFFDNTGRVWKTVVENPIERSLRKVGNLTYRKQLRQGIKQEWTSPAVAPGALFVLHGNSKKEHWKGALSAEGLTGSRRPELLLIDAISTSNDEKQRAIRRIPDFLKCAEDIWEDKTGTLIFTDDPRTFFVLRAMLATERIAFETRVFAGEGDESFLSPTPYPDGWAPEQKSNTRLAVSIVDRDAASVALTFQTLATAVGNEDSSGHRALMAACLYILRLSNMPAGYKDLADAVATDEFGAFEASRRSWTPVELEVRAAMECGVFGASSGEVQNALRRAQRLIDGWTDATPMAQRLLNEIRRYAIATPRGLTVILPDQRTIGLTARFLQRQLGDKWTTAEPHIHWQTHSLLKKSLGVLQADHHFVFVGVTPDVQRIILADPHIPHDSAILLPYKHAESMLKTLESMKQLDALKAYRGRIGLLIQELQRRLAEVPNPIRIERLAEFSMTFSLDEPTHSNGCEQTYYKFDLEGGDRAYASGWVYRFEPEDDPPFKRTAASQVSPGDEIFEMSDALRDKIETALQLNPNGQGSVAQPARTFLRLYHNDVQYRCGLLFAGITKRRPLAIAIHARMLELDKSASDCSADRVMYWLDLDEQDTRPHAAKDPKFFKLFCKALDIDEQATANYWGFVKNARRFSQSLGRQLAARYAEILFQPESAGIYRKLSQELIHELQADALNCVHRVERIIPPSETEAKR